MRKEERLFLAIGAADPALLERSERKDRSFRLGRGGLAAAACLAVLCALPVYTVPRPAAPAAPEITPPPDTVQTAPEVLALTGGDIGELHLVAVRYGPGRDEAADDFILYINEERYCGTWEGESYAVRPRVPSPEGLPECSLTVSHRPGASLEAVLAETRAALEEEFDMVEDQPGTEGRMALSAWDGDESGAEWDAANAAVTLTDDRQGGVFLLTARYFTEAAEGHGARFADMMETFRPETAAGERDWTTALREAGERLAEAVFADDLDRAADLLAEGAEASGWGEDVSEWVSVASIDCAIPGGYTEIAAEAEVSVRFRLGAEEPYSRLVMEMTFTEGRWLAERVRAEALEGQVP